MIVVKNAYKSITKEKDLDRVVRVHTHN